VEAHVEFVLDFLKEHAFDSFTYLSSTRIYGSTNSVAKEEDPIQVKPLKFDDIYNISKVMGESVCFASNRRVYVVRLSNVYGYDPKSENFIFTLIRDAINNKKIVLNVTLDSCKDHISVKDVANMLYKITTQGNKRLYNLASGFNISVGQITDRLRELTGCEVVVSEDAQKICMPTINIDHLRSEFEFTPANLIDDLESLVNEYKSKGRINQ
jgi:nucleoside-diphosphate-sugar epimerase